MTEPTTILDAITQQTFDEQVLQPSARVPVLVDFWAAWCAPCRVLMPLLQTIVASYDGKVRLATVNSDEQPELANAYGIRSLPTVKLFRDGEVVGEFSGVQPESVIRELIDEHIARPSAASHQRAVTALQQGDIAQALTLLQHAHAEDPANHRLTIELAGLQMQTGNIDDAETLLRALPAQFRSEDSVRQLLALGLFARAKLQNDDLAAVQQQAHNEPGNLQVRFQLASHLILAEDYAVGIELLLTILQQDRQFGDDLARRALLAVFDILGERHELVQRNRRRLASLLH